MRDTFAASVAKVFAAVAVLTFFVGQQRGWSWWDVLCWAGTAAAGWALLLAVGGALAHGVERR